MVEKQFTALALSDSSEWSNVRKGNFAGIVFLDKARYIFYYS